MRRLLIALAVLLWPSLALAQDTYAIETVAAARGQLKSKVCPIGAAYLDDNQSYPGFCGASYPDGMTIKERGECQVATIQANNVSRQYNDHLKALKCPVARSVSKVRLTRAVPAPARDGGSPSTETAVTKPTPARQKAEQKPQPKRPPADCDDLPTQEEGNSCRAQQVEANKAKERNKIPPTKSSSPRTGPGPLGQSDREAYIDTLVGDAHQRAGSTSGGGSAGAGFDPSFFPVMMGATRGSTSAGRGSNRAGSSAVQAPVARNPGRAYDNCSGLYACATR